ncbi:MAG: hypothetical protein AAF658_16210, partial [Myxococcota bacterium]
PPAPPPRLDVFPSALPKKQKAEGLVHRQIFMQGQRGFRSETRTSFIQFRLPERLGGAGTADGSDHTRRFALCEQGVGRSDVRQDCGHVVGGKLTHGCTGNSLGQHFEQCGSPLDFDLLPR